MASFQWYKWRDGFLVPEERLLPDCTDCVLSTVYWNLCVLIPKFLKRQNRQMSAADGDCKILTKYIPMVSIVCRSLPQYATRCVDPLPISRNFLHSVEWFQLLFLFELKFMNFPNPLKLGTILRYFFMWLGKKVPLKLLRHIRCNFNSTLLFNKVYKGTDGTLIGDKSHFLWVRTHTLSFLDHLCRNIF